MVAGAASRAGGGASQRELARLADRALHRRHTRRIGARRALGAIRVACRERL